MPDPFRPNHKTQLVREAQIGLSVVAIVFSLFLYVAFYRITGRGRHLPEHVRNAPVAETVWPDATPSNELAMTPKRFEQRRSENGNRTANWPAKQKSFDADRPSSYAAPKFGSENASNKIAGLEPRSEASNLKAPNALDPNRSTVSASTFASKQKAEASKPNDGDGSKRSLTSRLGSFIGGYGKKKNPTPIEVTKNVAVSKENIAGRFEPQPSIFDSPGELSEPLANRDSKPSANLDVENQFARIPNELRKPSAESSIPTDVSNDFQVKLASGTSAESVETKNHKDVLNPRPSQNDSRRALPVYSKPKVVNTESVKEFKSLRNGNRLSPGVHLPATKPRSEALKMIGNDRSIEKIPNANFKGAAFDSEFNKPTIKSSRPTEYSPAQLPLRAARAAQQSDQNFVLGNAVNGNQLRSETAQQNVSVVNVEAMDSSMDQSGIGIAQISMPIQPDSSEGKTSEHPPTSEHQPTSEHPPTYIVREGDSFWSVAQNVYDDPRFFSALYKHNQVTAPNFDDLITGTRLETPTKSELRELFPSESPAAVSATSSDEVETQSKLETRFYVTRPGDTLWSIAADRMGQASRYLDIYRVNQIRLDAQTDPNAPLPVGVRLVLPIQ